VIEVVAGILVQDRRILLQQRPSSKDFAFQWENPGGKVDQRESHHGALARELREELGIEVARERRCGVDDQFCIAERSIWCGKVGSERHGEVFILFYRVEKWAGTPAPREGQGLGWFTEKEFCALSKTPGNEAARREICRAVWGSW
jgi:8-oxo-dGTP diphosphatase